MGIKFVPTNNNSTRCMSSNIMVKIQKGGTCWFHTAVNGWLLSERGRELMKKMLSEYKKTHKLSNNNTGSCPIRGKLPLGYFWHYIEFMLKPATSRDVSNIVMNTPVEKVIVFRNNAARNALAGMTVKEFLYASYNGALDRNTWTRARENLKRVLNLARRDPQNFLNTHLVANVGLRNIGTRAAPLTLNNVYRAYGTGWPVQKELAHLGVNSLNKLTINKLVQVEAKGLNVKNLKKYVNNVNAAKPYILNRREELYVSGGRPYDAILFCRLLFGQAYSNKNTTGAALVTSRPFPLGTGVPVQKVIEINGVRYLLSHAYIVITRMVGTGHAITGFVCGKTSYLADSNSPRVLDFDWANAPAPGPVINQYAVEHYSLSFSPGDSLLFYIREDASNFVPEFGTLGNRRSGVSKLANLGTRVSTARSMNALNNLRKEINKLPNQNSAEVRHLRAIVKKEVDSFASIYLNQLVQNKNNVRMMRMLINKYNKAPYANHKEFNVVRSQALRFYQNSMKALINNAIAGGNQANMAAFLRAYEKDPHPVVKNAVARLKAHLKPKKAKLPTWLARFL